MSSTLPQEGGKKGLVCGAFDLLHAGHILMLKDAKDHCDFLVAGLQFDPSVTDASYRGKKKAKPLMCLEERRIILKGIKYIDEIFEYNDEPDLLEVIKTFGPHVRILGSDWEGRRVTGQEYATEVYYHKRNHNFSTSNLREKVKNSQNNNQQQTKTLRCIVRFQSLTQIYTES